MVNPVIVMVEDGVMPLVSVVVILGLLLAIDIPLGIVGRLIPLNPLIVHSAAGPVILHVKVC